MNSMPERDDCPDDDFLDDGFPYDATECPACGFVGKYPDDFVPDCCGCGRWHPSALRHISKRDEGGTA